MPVESSTVKQSIEKGINWAWAGTGPDGIWSRTIYNPIYKPGSSWTDSSELLYGMLLAGANPADARVKKAANTIKEAFSGTYEQGSTEGHKWKKQYQRFRKNIYVGLVLLSTNDKSCREFEEVTSSLKTQRVGNTGWTDGDPLEANIYNTCIALEFLSKAGMDHRAQEEGRRWLASAQYRDGGWGWWMGERSNATCTGMAAMHLLNTEHHDAAKKGVEWLLRTRRVLDEGRWPLAYEAGGDQDGSLVSMLGHADAYIHFSTAHAVRTLTRSGMDINSPAIQDAIKYLIAIQKPDGGWGATGWERQYSPCDKTISIVYFTGHALIALDEYLKRLSR
jgi:hypothetical protein